MRTGSSPLTRGKHFSDAHFAALSRLIPAHAGKTRTRLARALSSTAHPRSRGENVSQRAGRWYASGSSPLTRGKPAGTSSITRMEGLIPAHAGKTHEGRTRRDDLEAHPRSRGENTPAALSRVKVNGSSPLTRGKLDVLSADHPERRLIPAHAGKTDRPDPWASQRAAHPRSRGENCAWRSAISDIRGSSPLTRGKLDSNVEDELRDRLIPAHAGKTMLSSGPCSRVPAHPRSRGENIILDSFEGLEHGSSPLTRGKHRLGFTNSATRRLIPAHAGKTHLEQRVPCIGGAHPRSRGENGRSARASRVTPGSSPLTRGKLAPRL